MAFSGPIRIMEGTRYALDSYGNGAAYTLRNKIAQTSVWLQGDDAATFREELEAQEAAHPNKNPDYILSWLWDDCDYGLAAQSDD
ncbi:hypothetical protein CcrColossus_gp001 [Caulobacter phage CcrColossus]|uniref:Uncharacterized protein n=1 Tax=Caulobacter phage CcrColossus TaxID=1211640 RepID=K4JS15_9CAUD|nr:hypothetical protein CcrColossus_gp001 [Caulobacter phage CcrColossus]AFU87871.1 hypothetical protein CcrColossus_gp001 [Caulobacter phage CcrColossus]